jgi:integrase
MAWAERWQNGRVWIAKDGQRTFYALIDGRMVSTRKHTEEEALQFLMQRPGPRGEVKLHPFAPGLIGEYRIACLKAGQSRHGVAQKQRHLTQWSERVAFRPVTLKLLNGIVPSMTGSRNKVASLKAYFTWLRQQGHIARTEDPTLDLAKPSAPETDWDRVIRIEDHRKVVEWMEKNERLRWADLLTVLLSTGWHVSELLRFVRGGTIDGEVVICPRHKSGEPHRTRVSKVGLKAAQRSLKAGTFSPSLFYREVAEACEKVKVERFGPGSYRHTVATNAVRQGASPEEVAHFLGHKGSYMVKAIYAKVAVPKKVPTLE